MSNVQKSITILNLYPSEMNIYGDRGNVLTLLRRAQWHGYSAKLLEHHPGKSLPKNIDLIVGGGGQDSGQLKVEQDLFKIGSDLHKLTDDNVPMLMVCGLYQLFGHRFLTKDSQTIRGIGIFNLETRGGPTRLIGNTIIDSDWGKIIGYENHSGLTYLGEGQKPLGKVTQGAGNNGEDKTEGAVTKNVFGTYLHGSLLPKNPEFADHLLALAAERKYGEFESTVIDDRFAMLAREVAEKRPR